MRILNEKFKFHAPIAHVYACFIDISYFEKDLKRELGREVTLDYDKTKSNDELSEVIVNNKSEPMFKIIPTENVKNEYLRSELVPLAKPLVTFGSADMECRFYSNGKSTEVAIQIVTKRNPKIFWRLFTKIIILILMLQSRSDIRRFIKYVEASA